VADKEGGDEGGGGEKRGGVGGGVNAAQCTARKARERSIPRWQVRAVDEHECRRDVC
jgi:hypothetical protein